MLPESTKNTNVIISDDPNTDLLAHQEEHSRVCKIILKLYTNWNYATGS